MPIILTLSFGLRMVTNLKKFFKNKRCLVTGGGGFIGSNLSKYLNKLGADVITIDNFSSGQEENVSDFEELGIRLIRADITNQKDTSSFYKDVNFVFHHAAIASVPYSLKNPQQSQYHNVDGTISVLKNSSTHGITKVIFASSSAIYGETKTIPTGEKTLPMPQSPYAEQKLEGESCCLNFYESTDLRTTSLRYFNVFGPHQNPKSEYSAVIPKFINLAINNEDLIIYGDGKATRDFVFVDDVICANLVSAISTASDGEVINIGSGQRISIEKLAQTIVQMTDSNSKIKHDKPRKGDIIHSEANIEKAKKMIAYTPTSDMGSSLLKTIEYFKKR